MQKAPTGDVIIIANVPDENENAPYVTLETIHSRLGYLSMMALRDTAAQWLRENSARAIQAERERRKAAMRKQAALIASELTANTSETAKPSPALPKISATSQGIKIDGQPIADGCNNANSGYRAHLAKSGRK